MNLIKEIAEDDGCIAKKISFFTKLGLNIASYALIIMTLMVAINTIFRFLPFLKALNFVEEYSGYFFLIISFLGFADTLREGAHVRVNLVISKLKKKLRDFLDIATSILALIIISVLLYHSFNFFIEALISHDRAQTVTQTPLWIPRMFLVPGYVFLILEIIRHLAKAISRYRVSEE